MELLMGGGQQAIAISAAAVGLLRMWGPVILVGATALWVLPMFLAMSIGDAKNRYGIAYGLWLSWVGVLVIALLPPLSADDGVT